MLQAIRNVIWAKPSDRYLYSSAVFFYAYSFQVGRQFAWYTLLAIGATVLSIGLQCCFPHMVTTLKPSRAQRGILIMLNVAVSLWCFSQETVTLTIAGALLLLSAWYVWQEK